MRCALSSLSSIFTAAPVKTADAFVLNIYIGTYFSVISSFDNALLKDLQVNILFPAHFLRSRHVLLLV